MSDIDFKPLKVQPQDPAEILDLHEQLEAYRTLIQPGWGQKGVEDQHVKGKLTARERWAQLLDPDSFVELDSYLVHKCGDFGMEKRKYLGDGVITGYGRSIVEPCLSPLKILLSLVVLWAPSTRRKLSMYNAGLARTEFPSFS
jgi:acetyl-CoA carboxylase carboxyltransferase component